MSAEPHVDPEILQELDSVYEELRAAELEMLPMPEENERLRARLERLQQGQKELRSALRLGQSGLEPHLPGSLDAPFQVRATPSEARRVREVLSLLVSGALVLLLQWAYNGPGLGTLLFWLAVFLGVRLAIDRSRLQWWVFQKETIEISPVPERRSHTRVYYSQVFEAEARATPAQQRRGVGTVVVKYRIAPGAAEHSIQIENVPEPERLAKWILSRSNARPPDGR